MVVPELDCPELEGGVVVALGVLELELGVLEELELGVELPLAALPEVLDWPEVLPEVAPLAASFMHFSFSAPIRCAHLEALTPEAALPLVLDWPLVLPLAAGVELDGVLLAPELDWPVVLPLAAPLLGLLDWAAVEPLDCAPVEPEVCAYETADSARSAEAVALTRIFSIMWCAPLGW